MRLPSPFFGIYLAFSHKMSPRRMMFPLTVHKSFFLLHQIGFFFDWHPNQYFWFPEETKSFSVEVQWFSQFAFPKNTWYWWKHEIHELIAVSCSTSKLWANCHYHKFHVSSLEYSKTVVTCLVVCLFGWWNFLLANKGNRIPLPREFVILSIGVPQGNIIKVMVLNQGLCATSILASNSWAVHHNPNCHASSLEYSMTVTT